MRSLFLLSNFIFLSILAKSQAPQFAVVRPDGTTYICPTWDSAYNRANSGDYIYLPGGIINTTTVTISKKIFIYGAGHHPDSTITTTVSTIQGDCRIVKGADEGSVEGVNFTGNITFGTGINNLNRANVQYYTIKRCRTNYIYFNGSSYSSTAAPDSLPSNIMIIENIFGSSLATFGYCINNNFSKNLITSSVQALQYCSFNNNIFLVNAGTPIPLVNCNFSNNIFCSNTTFNQCGSNFYNNLKVGSSNFLSGCSPGDGSQSGNISVSSVSDIFIFYNGSGFLYTDNYHLKPTCPGINAGTDGTDVGIYGTTLPTAEGWVPSNPHIYFKQVAPQTNSNGQLPVQFKVRANN